MRLASCVALLLMLGGIAQAQADKAEDKNDERGNPKLGLILAKEYCARCHAIDKFGASPLAIAPPFRDLHLRYPVGDLAESLGEGIRTGHPTMPEFRFDPDQIENFIAYLKTLEQ
ncbi:MAG: c-type cytochrome [Methylovirgula sp.]